jgi:hypothetical protein
MWEEVVEVSWHAPAGGAAFVGSSETDQITPPWPGDYRVRVCARGRDERRDQYEVVVWRSPAADPVVHKRSDRLGHVLRGEPEPPATADEVYRWVESGWLDMAATVTFVVGKSSLEVLRAIGADETAPTPIIEFSDRGAGNIDPWVCVLDVPGGTVAVEYNGWQGSLRPVLRALTSPDNLAASMYWSVNGVHRLSIARDGNVLAQFELGMEDTTSPEALELLTDLDVHGRHRSAVGLLAATRFTGISMSAEDLARIQAADIGYPILALLPDLRPMYRHPDGSLGWPPNSPLGSDIIRLVHLSDEELRDLAWWAAAFAVAHSEPLERFEQRAATATLAARALTPKAELLARGSQSYTHEHHWLWATLHAATNPDSLAAAIESLNAAYYAVPGHVAELQDYARAQLR